MEGRQATRDSCNEDKKSIRVKKRKKSSVCSEGEGLTIASFDDRRQTVGLSPFALSTKTKKKEKKREKKDRMMRSRQKIHLIFFLFFFALLFSMCV
jgi:hypothetical protein